jgi:hypothetical protein
MAGRAEFFCGRNSLRGFDSRCGDAFCSGAVLFSGTARSLFFAGALSRLEGGEFSGREL